jgi:hypothetical protein
MTSPLLQRRCQLFRGQTGSAGQNLPPPALNLVTASREARFKEVTSLTPGRRDLVAARVGNQLAQMFV